MSEQWYYTSSGTRLGPVTHEELRRQAAAGRLQPNDLVWCDRLPQWVSAQSVEELWSPLAESHVATATLSPPAPSSLWDDLKQQQAAHAERHAERDTRDSRDPEADVPEVMRAPRRSSRQPDRNLQLYIVFGLCTLALVVVGIVVAVFVSAAKDPGNVRSFPIRPGEVKAYEVKLEAGVKTQIWVTSERNTDIDLVVWDPYFRVVQKDERDHKDCYVEFVPTVTGTYRFEVRNININSKLPVGRNHCTLRVEPPLRLVSQH